jgi:gamma-D-glutamyl-L-lysine dipeptidyl-peptidase
MSNRTKRMVRVAVAGVWTETASPRKIDEPALASPVHLQEWLQNLGFAERLQLCEDNLLQTQVLYGTPLEIVEELGDWVHVVIPEQPTSKNKAGYPGWMPAAQLGPDISDPDGKGSLVEVRAEKAPLYDENGQLVMEVSFLTRLPLLAEELDRYAVATPDGRRYLQKSAVAVVGERGVSDETSGARIIEMGRRFIDLPYLWGGLSAYGYDCSGFAYSMHQAVGITIPRDASDQSKGGREIPKNELLPGDLLFFAYEKGKGYVHHVGIYAGDGCMIHAPRTGRNVEIIQLRGFEYEAEHCISRRYWQGCGRES